MRNRPSILLPIAAGFAVLFVVMLILFVAGFGEPGGLAGWLGLTRWLGGGSQESSEYGIPLSQAIAVVDLLIALLAIAVTTRLTWQRENALIAEMDRAEGTLEALTQPVIRLDGRYRIDYLNPAAYKLLGETPDNRPDALNLIDNSNRRPLLAALLAEPDNDEQIQLPPNTRLITRQGIELEVDGSCRVVRDMDGRIQVVILLLRDITEEREWTRLQPDLWDRDPLTTLPGRNFMIGRLTRILERERAGDRPLSYIQIELDGIQRVYSEAGQRAGDALVRHLTVLIRPHIRDTDLLARMDTQVFGVLLTLCPAEVTERIMHGMLETLSAGHFYWEGTTYTIQARVSHVRVPPFQGTVDELLEAAERHA
jgi:diguanylate cyclase (GGDEF)-like protein